MDKNLLKAQALKQRIAEITADYEEKLAEFRVEYTILMQQNNELSEELKQLQEQDVQEETPTPSE